VIARNGHKRFAPRNLLFASARSVDSTMSADTMHVDDCSVINDRICKQARVHGVDCIGIHGVSRQRPSWRLYPD